MNAITDSAEEIARCATERGLRVAVAESLTGGRVASALGEAPDASEWFCGGVVAYAPHVKFEVLGVTPGPVVTERCAREMAAGVARALRADVTVGLTGVGGPDPDEGEPAGTLFLATSVLGAVTCEHVVFPGDPGRVVEASTRAALEHLLRGVSSDRARVPRHHD
jgi:nicotinamide-nucleotide amidase